MVMPWVVLLILIGGLALWSALPDGLVIENTSDDLEAQMDATLLQNFRDYQWWYKGNLLTQVLLILASIGATVFAAITTQRNAETIKKWSVLLTALTAGSAAFLTTFHVRENLEAFIAANEQIQQVEAEYLAERANTLQKLKAKGWDAAVEVPKMLTEIEAQKARQMAAQKDGKPASSTTLPSTMRLPEEWLVVQKDYTVKFSQIQTKRLRSWTNIGPQLVTPEGKGSTTALAPGSENKPPQKGSLPAPSGQSAANEPTPR